MDSTMKVGHVPEYTDGIGCKSSVCSMAFKCGSTLKGQSITATSGHCHNMTSDVN